MMAKTRRKRHAIKRLPPGIARGAYDHAHTASGNGRAARVTPEDFTGAPDGELRGDTRVWLGVLAQAIMDAKSRRTKDYKTIIRDAQHWLFHDEADFAFVCDAAGLDAEWTRTRILAAQSRGFAWRAGAPQLTKHERTTLGSTAVLFDLGILEKPAPRRPMAKRKQFVTRQCQLAWEF